MMRGKTNLDLIEAMENQNKQILLKLSPSLSSLKIVLLVPSKMRIAIDSQNEQEPLNKTFCVCGLCFGFSIRSRASPNDYLNCIK